jgi:type IV pilus assembly protein PilA
MKQCANCKNSVADFVTASFCGTALAVAPLNPAQQVWTAVPEKSGKATASLVCGILLCFAPMASVVAVVMGHLALSDIKKSAGRLTGQGLAIAGLVLGYFGLLIAPLIIAAIAIPNFLRARMAANEASAVGSLRTYNTAMATYANQCPQIGYPKELSNLGGPAGGDRCARADLVSGEMAAAAPVKSGYRFTYIARADANGVILSYVLSADPVSPGGSGVRHFFTDQTAVIRMSAKERADSNSMPLE